MIAVRMAIIEVDIPRVARIVGTGRPRPDNRTRWSVGKIGRINSWTNPIKGNNSFQLFHGRHPPVGVATETSAIDPGREGLGIAVGGRLPNGIALAGVTGIIITISPAVGAGVGIVPIVGVILVAQTTIGSLDLPDQAGDIVAGAGPLSRAAAQGGGSGQFRAAVGNLGEAESGMAIGVVVMGHIPAMGAVLSANGLAGAVGIIAQWIAAAPVEAGVVEMRHKWRWWRRR